MCCPKGLSLIGRKHTKGHNMKIIFCLFIFLVLTIITQVGGLIFLLCLPLFHFINKKIKNPNLRLLSKTAMFLALYFAICFTIIPFIAALFGRYPLPITNKEKIRPNNILSCLLNRHYVRKEMLTAINQVSRKLNTAHDDYIIYYLDAGFPFINGFPMLPHLSHSDGRKLDITYYYKDTSTNEEIHGSPSWLGYGFCEGPVKNEINTTAGCISQGYWQYDLLRHLVSKSLKGKYKVNERKTAILVKAFANEPTISMIFIEPHLKQRWGLKNIEKIRFQGCRAVRHDDHIHIQIY